MAAIGLVAWIMCAITTAIIAGSRDRSAVAWLFIGLIMGVFGLILVIVLPAANRRLAPASFNNAFPLIGAGRKKVESGVQCPDCKQEVELTARQCPHCSLRLA